MVKKNILLSLLFIFPFYFAINAQSTYSQIDNTKIKNIKINYVAIFQDSIQNYPLFFPENSIADKRNLIESIVWGIEEYNIPVYKNFSHIFVNKLSLKEVKLRLGEIDTVFSIDASGNIDTSVLNQAYIPAEIILYIIEEAWLYDFSDSLIDKRLVAICPVRKYYRDDDIYKREPRYQKMFCAQYKDFEDVFKNQTIFDVADEPLGNMNDFLTNLQYNAVQYSTTMYNTYFYDTIPSVLFANETSADVISSIPNVNFVNTNRNTVILSDTFVDLGQIFKPFNELHFTANYQLGTPNKYSKITDTVVAAKLVYKHVWRKDVVNSCLFLPQPNRLYVGNKDTLINPFGYVNLFDFLMKSIGYRGFKAYGASLSVFGNEYDDELSFSEIYTQAGAKVEKMLTYIDDDFSILDTVYLYDDYSSQNIVSYIFQEIEFYNTAGEIVQTRVVGVCPIRKFYRDDDFERTDPRYYKTFWVNFSEFQPIAATQNILKTNFSASQTFDDFIFNQNYVGYNFNSKLAQFNPSFYPEDSVRLAQDYNHNFVNLYSDHNIVNCFNDDFIFKTCQNHEYKIIKRKDYSSAKVVYTQIDANVDTSIFISHIQSLGFSSFIEIITKNIQTGQINSYRTSKLKKKIAKDESFMLLGEKIEVLELYNGDTIHVKIPVNFDEFSAYKLKELWLYDKLGNIIEKRIIAIQPIRKFYAEDDWDQLEPIYTETFWISFVEIQDILKSNMIPQYNFSLPSTYNNYFVDNQYEFAVLETNKISKWKTNKLLKLFK